jgi:Fe-S oxidoreductase
MVWDKGMLVVRSQQIEIKKECIMDNNFEEKKTYTGNWKCGKCGAAITSLPFDPDPSRLGSLKCRDCHRKEQEAKGQGPRSFR